MLKRLAPLVPFALIMTLAACASHVQQSQPVAVLAPQTSTQPVKAPQSVEEVDDAAIATLLNEQDYELPNLADSILDHGLTLVGTRYRYGGSSVKSGFDCSGFIGYLFKEELGLQLPRSSRDMINIDAPKVARDELEPGDLLFFSTAGRNRISHAGIYMGDNQFIHSSSSRSGGVRVDSLEDRYWARTFVEAKRALALAQNESDTAQR